MEKRVLRQSELGLSSIYLEADPVVRPRTCLVLQEYLCRS